MTDDHPSLQAYGAPRYVSADPPKASRTILRGCLITSAACIGLFFLFCAGIMVWSFTPSGQEFGEKNRLKREAGEAAAAQQKSDDEQRQRDDERKRQEDERHKAEEAAAQAQTTTQAPATTEAPTTSQPPPSEPPPTEAPTTAAPATEPPTTLAQVLDSSSKDKNCQDHGQRLVPDNGKGGNTLDYMTYEVTLVNESNVPAEVRYRISLDDSGQRSTLSTIGPEEGRRWGAYSADGWLSTGALPPKGEKRVGDSAFIAGISGQCWTKVLIVAG